MSTVTTRPPVWNRDETQRRVAHPLQRLRGAIRLYVAGEGLAVTVLYLSLWFWIGLLLDYGVFKAFALDWVQVLPHTFRVVVFGLLLAGLLAVVAVKMVLRLVREFRNAALALVLERRFPGLLGDRLITAVELADTRLAERYGYSQAMIDQTIRDAAERVDRVPVNEVFNWKRLWNYGLLALSLTLGLYLLTGVGYCLALQTSVGEYVQRFNEVSGIWFERNVLLIDTIWPRRAHLELVNFPFEEKSHLRDEPLTLRVRALQWVVADSDRKRAPEGWRALQWTDLTEDLVGVAVPQDLAPADWRGQSIDWIELQLEKADAPVTIDEKLALREVLDNRLVARAATPGMGRRLRKLELPRDVAILYRGATLSSEQSLQKEADNEYSVTLTDLKESIRFTVRGEDYYTPYRKVSVVPPPTIVELLRDDERPAYLYHRIPAQGQATDLRGKRQKVQGLVVSLTGDASRIEVPSGSDVVLTARTDRKLIDPGGVRIVPPREGAPRVEAPIAQIDALTFQATFRHVTRPLDFVFEFMDTENYRGRANPSFEDRDLIKGRRRIVIRPTEDLPPEVDVQIEVLRKTNRGYLCTPVADVPFSGKVRDDWGLAGVEYNYTLTRLESQANQSARMALAAGAIPMSAGGAAYNIVTVALLTSLSRSAEEEDTTPKRTSLTTFARTLRDKSGADDTLEKLLRRLEEAPPQQGLLKEYNLDPAFEEFKIEPLGLKVTNENVVQPHYRLRLWVEATDSNIETGPKVGESKERFTLLIVSENELLLEIGKEEESLHVKLEDAVNRLKDAKTKLDKVASELPELKADEFSPMTRRAEEIGEVIVKSWDATREVYSDYRRIHAELVKNRVDPRRIEKVNTQICVPLERAILTDFGDSEKSMNTFKETLTRKERDAKSADQAREDLKKLLDNLDRVLESMSEVITINRLIEQLTKIKNAEDEEYQRLLKLKQEQERKLLDQLIPGK